MITHFLFHILLISTKSISFNQFFKSLLVYLLRKIFLFLFFTICIPNLVGCKWDDNDIRKWQWKNKEGNGVIGQDWLDFKNGSWKILNDTIYKKGIKVAVVIEFNHRISDKELIIKAINSPDTGYFVSK